MPRSSAARPSPAHYFQTLDRAHVASTYLQATFGGDPVLRRHAELRELWQRAVDSMEQLYQAVAQLDDTLAPSRTSRRAGARRR